MYVGRNLAYYPKHSQILHANRDQDRRKRRSLLQAIKYPKHWGNPFKINEKKGVTRDRSIELYKRYAREHLVEHVTELCDKNGEEKEYGCWCDPLPCHGDTLPLFHAEF
jgi:hypothetical protein